MNYEYFECECHSPEHRLVFGLDTESEFGDNPELWAEFYLKSYRNIFQRIWVAVKYVFGGKTKWGHFDCWLLRYEDAVGMKDMLDKFIVASDKWAESKLDQKAYKEI